MTTTTAVELGRDGTRTVFHRRDARAWTHPVGDPYMTDVDRRLSCPVCNGDAKSVLSTKRTKSCKRGHDPSGWRTLKSGKSYCLTCAQESKARKAEAAAWASARTRLTASTPDIPTLTVTREEHDPTDPAAWSPRAKAGYRKAFKEQNGKAPWPCVLCQGPVYDKTLVVQHRDGNHANNDPRNLTASHARCHDSLHDAEARGERRGRQEPSPAPV